MKKERVRKTELGRFPREAFFLILPGLYWLEWLAENKSSQLPNWSSPHMIRTPEPSMPDSRYVSTAVLLPHNWAHWHLLGVQSPVAQWHASEGSSQKLILTPGCLDFWKGSGGNFCEFPETNPTPHRGLLWHPDGGLMPSVVICWCF